MISAPSFDLIRRQGTTNRERHMLLAAEGSSQTQLLAVSANCPKELRNRSSWHIKSFVLVKEVGSGAASTVYYALCRRSCLPVAIKIYSKKRMSSLNLRQVQREVDIHASLNHPHIIELYASFEDAANVYLVMEYASGGDLFDDSKRRGGRLSEGEAVQSVLYPYLCVLLYLHSRGVIHRDIKPENTVFTRDHVMKIADFGLSINCREERPVTRLGTLDYMAPEVLRCPDKTEPDQNKELVDMEYGHAVDAWAMGILAYELIVGRPPFGMTCRMDTMRAIVSNNPHMPRWLSADAADFIRTALHKGTNERATAASLIQHPWILKHTRESFSPQRSPSCSIPQAPRISGGSQKLAGAAGTTHTQVYGTLPKDSHMHKHMHQHQMSTSTTAVPGSGASHTSPAPPRTAGGGPAPARVDTARELVSKRSQDSLGYNPSCGSPLQTQPSATLSSIHSSLQPQPSADLSAVHKGDSLGFTPSCGSPLQPQPSAALSAIHKDVMKKLSNTPSADKEIMWKLSDLSPAEEEATRKLSSPSSVRSSSFESLRTSLVTGTTTSMVTGTTNSEKLPYPRSSVAAGTTNVERLHSPQSSVATGTTNSVAAGTTHSERLHSPQSSEANGRARRCTVIRQTLGLPDSQSLGVSSHTQGLICVGASNQTPGEPFTKVETPPHAPSHVGSLHEEGHAPPMLSTSICGDAFRKVETPPHAPPHVGRPHEEGRVPPVVSTSLDSTGTSKDGVSIYGFQQKDGGAHEQGPVGYRQPAVAHKLSSASGPAMANKLPSGSEHQAPNVSSPPSTTLNPKPASLAGFHSTAYALASGNPGLQADSMAGAISEQYNEHMGHMQAVPQLKAIKKLKLILMKRSLSAAEIPALMVDSCDGSDLLHPHGEPKHGDQSYWRTDGVGWGSPGDPQLKKTTPCSPTPSLPPSPRASPTPVRRGGLGQPSRMGSGSGRASPIPMACSPEKEGGLEDLDGSTAPPTQPTKRTSPLFNDITSGCLVAKEPFYASVGDSHAPRGEGVSRVAGRGGRIMSLRRPPKQSRSFSVQVNSGLKRATPDCSELELAGTGVRYQQMRATPPECSESELAVNRAQYHQTGDPTLSETPSLRESRTVYPNHEPAMATPGAHFPGAPAQSALSTATTQQLSSSCQQALLPLARGGLQDVGTGATNTVSPSYHSRLSKMKRLHEQFQKTNGTFGESHASALGGSHGGTVGGSHGGTVGGGHGGTVNESHGISRDADGLEAMDLASELEGSYTPDYMMVDLVGMPGATLPELCQLQNQLQHQIQNQHQNQHPQHQHPNQIQQQQQQQQHLEAVHHELASILANPTKQVFSHPLRSLLSTPLDTPYMSPAPSHPNSACPSPAPAYTRAAQLRLQHTTGQGNALTGLRQGMYSPTPGDVPKSPSLPFLTGLSLGEGGNA